MPGATDGLVTLQKSYKAVLPWHQSGLANLQRTAIDGMELALHFSNEVWLMEQGFPTTRLPMAVLPCHGFELAQLFSRCTLWPRIAPHYLQRGTANGMKLVQLFLNKFLPIICSWCPDAPGSFQGKCH